MDKFSIYQEFITYVIMQPHDLSALHMTHMWWYHDTHTVVPRSCFLGKQLGDAGIFSGSQGRTENEEKNRVCPRSRITVSELTLMLTIVCIKFWSWHDKNCKQASRGGTVYKTLPKLHWLKQLVSAKDWTPHSEGRPLSRIWCAP